MIDWKNEEEEFCGGSFKIKSKFFCHEENDDVLEVGCKGPDMMECAEKCVEAFNNLTESEINQICKGIINYVKESDEYEDYELSALENPLDILNYCWFTNFYVNMASQEDEIAYVVTGEGDWGDEIGFVVDNNKIVYVGVDFFDYMKD